MSFDDKNDSENELPDWLKNLQDDTGDSADSISEPQDENIEGRKGRKFFSTGTSKETFDAASDEIASEYLQGENDEDEEDTKEWLKKIQEQQQPILDPVKTEEDEDSSDFLKQIQELKDEEASEKSDKESLVWNEELDQREKLDEENIDVPDWLQKIKDGEPATEIEKPENEEAGETGDWIKNFTGALDPSVVDPKTEFDIEDDLNWIIEQVDSIDDSSELTADAQKPTEDLVIEEPDWLSGMEEISDEFDDKEIPKIPISENIVEDNKVDDFQIEDLKLDSEDIPDWLDLSEPLSDSKTSSPKPQISEEEADDSAEGLNWLEEIRNSEDDEPEKELFPETSGPLLGLKNVLPSEPESVLFSTNPVQRVELFISNTQKSHISLLKNIVSDEHKISPIEKPKTTYPDKVFRWFIAGLLYLSIIIPVFTNQSTSSITISAPPEVIAMSEIVDALPPFSSVLVAFEYQPGLSGEMEAASAAVMEHLLTNDAQLSFITTSPTGPGLIEHYTSSLLSNFGYITDHKYPNFGYLSGGTAALINFASNPKATVPFVAMLNSDGKTMDGWKTEPLLHIKEINDFSMVLVITDDPMTASAWIEQVQPYLVDVNNPDNNIPLTMVASAQAEPLIFPYYDIMPKQVSALVSGLKGGVNYESLNDNKEQIASRYLDGFGIGISVTISIVLLGGIINLVQGLPRQRDKAR